MKKNNVLSLIIILIAIFVSSFKISVMAKETNSIAKGMVVIEGNSGDVLYSKNENLELPMASTTKIVTAIVAIENSSDLGEKFGVSEKAIGIEGTSIYLKSGEKLSLRELLYGLILASGNDCAIAIAEHIAGLDNFVGLMNEFASNLGLKHTNFKNPHGLDEDGHYTSAYDLSIMTAYALKNPIFREIVSTERMVIEKNDLYQARYLKHKNRLLFTDENCIGVKTGFTDNAGRCLVNAHEENGLQIISVVLNCQPMFEECDRLTKLAMSEYMMKEFWNTIQLIFTGIGGWLGYFLGGWDGLLYALIAFVVIDYLTGVMCAINDKTLSSEVGFKGICRKVLIFLLVGIAHILDVNVIGSGGVLRTAVIFFYISNEGVSLLENAAHLGLPVPEKIKVVLEQLHDRSESKEE